MYPTSVDCGLKPYATTIATYNGAVAPTMAITGSARFVHRGNMNRCFIIRLVEPSVESNLGVRNKEMNLSKYNDKGAYDSGLGGISKEGFESFLSKVRRPKNSLKNSSCLGSDPVPDPIWGGGKI
jgi:hypothetical protein